MHLLGWLIAILITLNRLGKLCRRQVCAIFSTIIGSPLLQPIGGYAAFSEQHLLISNNIAAIGLR